MKSFFLTIRRFTLVETVIALGVLMLALSAVFASIAASQQRVIRAEKRWQRQHLLTQAAEYYLLAPPSSQIPQVLFSNQQYRVAVEYNTPQLPDKVETVNGNWQLIGMKIMLFDQNDKKVDSITLERIIRAGEI